MCFINVLLISLVRTVWLMLWVQRVFGAQVISAEAASVGREGNSFLCSLISLTAALMITAWEQLKSKRVEAKLRWHYLQQWQIYLRTHGFRTLRLTLLTSLDPKWRGTVRHELSPEATLLSLFSPSLLFLPFFPSLAGMCPWNMCNFSLKLEGPEPWKAPQVSACGSGHATCPASVL